jgi:hypothetical protein
MASETATVRPPSSEMRQVPRVVGGRACGVNGAVATSLQFTLFWTDCECMPSQNAGIVTNPCGLVGARASRRVDGMQDCLRAIVEGDADGVLDTFMKRMWPQQEAIAITLQAWRRDKALGRPGWYMKDGGLLSAIYVAVGKQTLATFPDTKIDNASMLFILAAMATDDPELLALVWKWDPSFRIRGVGANGKTFTVAHDKIANDIFKDAPLCDVWYRNRFAA